MQTLFIGSGDMRRPAEIILRGGIVAVPTETVYGLAASGLDAAAVAKIYTAKGRPENKPISLLVLNMQDALKAAVNVPAAAFVLAEKFWPGPLTMILERSRAVPNIVAAGGHTVGVRCPDHPDTLALLRLCGVPLAAPSANLSGEESAKTAEAVRAVFDGRIDCIIDGGPCRVGTESTVLDMTVTPPRILRQGGLPRAELERALGAEVAV